MASSSSSGIVHRIAAPLAGRGAAVTARSALQQAVGIDVDRPRRLRPRRGRAADRSPRTRFQRQRFGAPGRCRREPAPGSRHRSRSRGARPEPFDHRRRLALRGVAVGHGQRQLDERAVRR
jgi:hypothetical protein